MSILAIFNDLDKEFEFLLSNQNIVKVPQKVFKAIVNELYE